jgi:diguanylate cyclase (GGDEF)-like protein
LDPAISLTLFFQTVLRVDAQGTVVERLGEPFPCSNVFACQPLEPLSERLRSALSGTRFEATVTGAAGPIRVCGAPHDGGAIIAIADSLETGGAHVDVAASPEAEFLFRNLRQGIWRISSTGLIDKANDWLADWLEIPADDLIGRAADQFLRERGPGADRFEAGFQTSKGVAKRAIVHSADLLGDQGEVCGRIELITDVTAEFAEREKLFKEMQTLARLARMDGLTGLGNRLAFQEALQELRSGGRSFGVIVADVDSFKLINDTTGHEAGDQALKEVAKRLRSCIRRNDLAARLGGDEFAILLPDATVAALEEIVKRLESRMSFEFERNGRTVHVAVSIGASHSDSGADDVFNAADQSMYRRKRIRRSKRP